MEVTDNIGILKAVARPKRTLTIRVMKSGEVRLSADLALRMGLEAGDKVTFFTSETREKTRDEVPELFIAKDECGYELKRRLQSKSSNALRFYSTRIAEKLLPKESTAETFNIGEAIERGGIQYYTVIHKQNRNEAKHRLQGIDKAAI